MAEKTLLEKIRYYTMWAVIASAAGLLLLTLLETWGAIDTSPSYDDSMMGGYGEPSAWGRIQDTLSVVMGLSFLSLVTIFVSSWVKKDDAA